MAVDASQMLDSLYKQHYGKLVFHLLAHFKLLRLEEAEDVVQDVFAKAMAEWMTKPMPAKPLAWLYTANKNRAINFLKRQQKFGDLPDRSLDYADPGVDVDNDNADVTLKMLFLCTHPDFSPKVQVVFALKYVANIRIESIGNALGMSVDAIDKLLFRARSKFRQYYLTNSIRISLLKQRLPVIHKIIYLIFNEGYKNGEDREQDKDNLCEGALLLCRELLKTDIGNAETRSLYSLMLLNAARYSARKNGLSLDCCLLDQDRHLYDQDLIELGNYYLSRVPRNETNIYFIEAMIARIHCTAKSFEETDWKTISSLYRLRLDFGDNPFVKLNLAIALFFEGEKVHAWRLFNELTANPFMHRYFYLNYSMAKCCFMEMNDALAEKFLTRALAQSKTPAQRELVKKLADAKTVMR